MMNATDKAPTTLPTPTITGEFDLSSAQGATVSVKQAENLLKFKSSEIVELKEFITLGSAEKSLNSILFKAESFLFKHCYVSIFGNAVEEEICFFLATFINILNYFKL